MSYPWSHIESCPPDPILSLVPRYVASENPNKVNLSVGAYRDENGKPVILESVKQAEELIRADPAYNHEYTPVAGYPEYKRLARELLFGEDHPALDRIVTTASISGSGALHLGGDFLRFVGVDTDIYVPNPTWGNHMALLTKAYGKTPLKYTYLAKDKPVLDFEGMKADMASKPEGSVFVLHPCAHNPSGVDLAKEMWDELIPIFKAHKFIAFFDSAYQGFATGSLANDAYAIRRFVAEGVSTIACQSFSKNLGLYGERAGAFHIVCSDPEEKDRVESNLCKRIRSTYSSHPAYGQRIVIKVLSTPELRAQWDKDVTMMCDRIVTMRKLLRSELEAISCPSPLGGDQWTHITDQIGMFSFTGLTPEQCDFLIEEKAIFLLRGNGRISMCGITPTNAKYVAESIKEAITKFN